MKKNKLKTMAAIFVLGVSVLAGCGAKTEDPGEPPAEVINGQSTDVKNNSVQVENSTNMEEKDKGDMPEDKVLANAISVRIGREGIAEWNVDMYNNDAALTMLDYLSGSALLFPTYTYNEEGGFVAQSVRGSYTRDDEQTIADVKTG